MSYDDWPQSLADRVRLFLRNKNTGHVVLQVNRGRVEKVEFKLTFRAGDEEKGLQPDPNGATLMSE